MLRIYALHGRIYPQFIIRFVIYPRFIQILRIFWAKWDLYILLQGKKSDEDFNAASIQKTGCHRSPDGETPLFSETAYTRASVQNGDRRINYDIFSEQKRVEGKKQTAFRTGASPSLLLYD